LLWEKKAPGVLQVLLSAAVALALPRSAPASVLEEGRKATRQALAVEVERFVLANGLVVLLSPDPTVSSVAVWMTFRAGALHEPPGRSGLAHLVEHVMASGPTPDTNYADLMERRHARLFNASTGFDALDFQAVVPSDELPLALWVAADRLATVPPLIDQAVVERHRRVVLQERAIRDVDAPYGLVREHLFSRLYGNPHPLHAGVIGSPTELANATPSDVRRFVEEHLVPANAILTLVGRFDPAVARRLVEDTLGRLPAGRPAPLPATPPPSRGLVEKKEEPLSRRPRVFMAWRFPDLPHEDAMALQIGAQLLTLLTDGAWDMRIGADLFEYQGESLFTMDLTVPYDEPVSAVHNDADGFLRQLTHKEMPLEHMITANRALDRAWMFELDTLEGRAHVLTRIEYVIGPRQSVADYVGLHWEMDGSVVRDTARRYLQRPKVVLHARPTRPKPARAVRE